MILTEAEAKEKACCKTMPHRPDGKLMTAACLASQCMAWRWHENVPFTKVIHAADQNAIQEPIKPINVPDNWIFHPYDEEDECFKAFWEEPEPEASMRRRGYCGMAGDPGIASELEDIATQLRHVCP